MWTHAVSHLHPDDFSTTADTLHTNCNKSTHPKLSAQPAQPIQLAQNNLSLYSTCRMRISALTALAMSFSVLSSHATPLPRKCLKHVTGPFPSSCAIWEDDSGTSALAARDVDSALDGGKMNPADLPYGGMSEIRERNEDGGSALATRDVRPVYYGADHDAHKGCKCKLGGQNLSFCFHWDCSTRDGAGLAARGGVLEARQEKCSDGPGSCLW